MVSLQDLNGGTPITKEWLKPVCSDFTAGVILADEIDVSGDIVATGTIEGGIVKTGFSYEFDDGTGVNCNIDLRRVNTNTLAFTDGDAPGRLLFTHALAPETTTVPAWSFLIGKSTSDNSGGVIDYIYNGIDKTIANAGGNLNSIRFFHSGSAANVLFFADGSVYFNGDRMKFDQGDKAGVGNNGLKLLDTTPNTGLNTGALQVSGGASIGENLHVQGLLNNYQVQGGVFSQIDTTTLTNTITETIILGSGIGTLTVPASIFKIGSTYSFFLSGAVSNLNNESYTYRLYGGPSSATLLATIALSTVPLTTAKNYTLRINMVVRNTGTAGVAQISINASYCQVTDAGGGVTFCRHTNVVETTLFNTTVNNVFTIKGQWASASASNSVTYSQINLNKDF